MQCKTIMHNQIRYKIWFDLGMPFVHVYTHRAWSHTVIYDLTSLSECLFQWNNAKQMEINGFLKVWLHLLERDIENLYFVWENINSGVLEIFLSVQGNLKRDLFIHFE